MKFTKEQLKEALKAKLTVNGRKTPLTDRTLQSQSETLYKFATEETELADFVSTIYPSIEGLEGQYRKDYSDFTKDYQSEWEKAHPQVQPKDDGDSKKGDGNAGSGSDAGLSAIMKKLQELEAKEAQRDLEKTISGKRSELSAKFKEKGISDEKWISSYLKKLAISTDTDIDNETADALALFNKSNSHIDTNTVPGAAGAQEPDMSHSFDDVKDILNRRRAGQGEVVQNKK